MKAVYTYYANPGDSDKKTNQGFSSTKDLARMLGYSVQKTKEQRGIDSVQLVCNTHGKELLIDRYKLPFDEVAVILDHLNDRLHPQLWAYAKIYAFGHQSAPFIHIDNDVLLLEQLHEKVLSAPLIFQNREDLITSIGYNATFEASKFFVPDTVFNHRPEWAYNCGVVGANDLNVVREWFDMVTDYVFNSSNRKFWRSCSDLHSQNHLFEQYFISSIACARNMHADIGLLLPNFTWETVPAPEFRMVHLWGDSKRNEQHMQKIADRLRNEFPETFDGIEYAEVDHSTIFSEIYDTKLWGYKSGGGSTIEATEEYRTPLQRFIAEKNITSVVDLGCGYWEFNELIDWNGSTYMGIDCVQKVIEYNQQNHQAPNRLWAVADIKTAEIPTCDLLIIKDVFIHWTNKEIQDFFNRSVPAKYILVTCDNQPVDINKDIKAGEFHQIDLQASPFNLNASVFLDWAGRHKRTILLTT